MLNALEMEFLWLGIESIYCHLGPKADLFLWDFILAHALVALHIELWNLPVNVDKHE